MKVDMQSYSVELLTPKDADVLQGLYERCTDYARLMDGAPPSPSAARDEFLALPEGTGVEDKFMFGLFCDEDLVGLLESVRRYPDEKTWWLGLLLLEPGLRGRGVGAAFYETFERFGGEQGLAQTMLSVAEENVRGLRFWRSLGFEAVRSTEPRSSGGKKHIFTVMRRDVGSTFALRKR